MTRHQAPAAEEPAILPGRRADAPQVGEGYCGTICLRCGAAAQFSGTSPAGAECFICTACDHVNFVAVSR